MPELQLERAFQIFCGERLHWVESKIATELPTIENPEKYIQGKFRRSDRPGNCKQSLLHLAS